MGEPSIPVAEEVFEPLRLTWRGRIFSWFWKKIIRFLFRSLSAEAPAAKGENDLDLTLTLPLYREETQIRSTKEVTLHREGKPARLLVKIPGGVQDGTVLRLRGMGTQHGGQVGDLYLRVRMI